MLIYEKRIPTRVKQVLVNFDNNLRSVIGGIILGEKITNRFSYISIRDLQDYCMLIKMIRNGYFKKAARFFYSLDTAARDNVPKMIVKWLDKYIA